MPGICFLLKNFTAERGEEKFANEATHIFAAFMKMPAIMLFTGKCPVVLFKVVKSFESESREKTGDKKQDSCFLIFSDLRCHHSSSTSKDRENTEKSF